MATKGLRALIIGGGTAGMCSAIMLGRQGVECDLVDIDTTWRPSGAGITPSAIRKLVERRWSAMTR